MFKPKYALILDCEALGEDILKNTTISLGVALVLLDKVQLVIQSGHLCKRQFLLPMLPGQEVDPIVLRNFWMRSDNIAQYVQWANWNNSEFHCINEIMKEFIDYIDWLTVGKDVILVVDHVSDAARVNALISITYPWIGKPKSWSYILKNNKGERYYTRIHEVYSYYLGLLATTPWSEKEWINSKGGLLAAIKHFYQIDEIPFKYEKDHFSDNDAARIGLDYALVVRSLQKRINNNNNKEERKEDGEF